MADYDITLTQGGTDYNFMLLKTNNQKAFRVSDAPLLPPMMITDNALPSSISPDRAIIIGQSDWRAGMQDLMLEDLKKYYKTENCDARFKGKVILSPKQLASLAYSGSPATYYIKDLEFEVWTDASTSTYWTKTGNGTYAIAREGTVIHGGTYSCELTHNPTNDVTISQSSVWNDSLQSTEINFKLYAKSADADASLRIGIYDGVGTTWCTAETGVFDWTQLTVTRTLNAAATECTFKVEEDGDGAVSTVYVDDGSITGIGGIGTCSSIVQFGTDIVAGSGSILTKLSGSNFVKTADFGYTITDLCVFDNRLFIAVGLDNAFYYTDDLSTFTASTATGEETSRYTTTTQSRSASDATVTVVDNAVFSGDNAYATWGDEIIKITDRSTTTLSITRAQQGSTATYHASGTEIRETATSTMGAKYMSNVGNSQFWITDSTNTMRVSDNPINNGTPFSTQYTVGDDSYEITGLVDDPSIVYVRKQDQPYYLSGADVLPLITDLLSEASTTVSYDLYPWGGNLYIPSGTNALYEYDSGAVTTLSPVSYAPGDDDFDEEITSMCGDGAYLYAAMDNGSSVDILAGRWENIDGTISWVWHPIYEITSNDIIAMLISNADGGSKRLYCGTGTYGDGILRFIVPVAYSDVLSETSYEVESSGDFVTPWLRGNFPTTTKYWSSIDVTNICVTDKTSMNIYYQKKGDSSWTLAGTCTPQDLVGGAYPAETTDTFTLDTKVYQYYRDHDDFAYLYSDFWRSQTFTTETAHTIKKVRLKLWRIAAGSGTLTVGIRAVDGSNKPTGSDLCSGTLAVTSLTTDTSGEWYTIDFGNGTSLDTNTRYAIVARSSASVIANRMYWNFDSSSPSYTTGEYLVSGDAGSAWTAHASNDFAFEEIGAIDISSERIRFKFSLAAADDDYSPILYGLGGGYSVEGKLQSDRKKQIEATILVQDEITERGGDVVERTVATDLTNLRALYDSTSVITLTAPDDTTYSVLFDRDGYSEQLGYDATIERNEVWWVTVKLLEV